MALRAPAGRGHRVRDGRARRGARDRPLRLLELVAHPQTPCTAVRSLRAGVARTAGGCLTATYRVEGAIERLRIPAPRVRAPGERLWQHTCCEMFVAPEGGAAYREFNFSPSGEWAAYAFTAYRQGAPLAIADPEIRIRRTPELLELEASIAVEAVSSRIALCVVIEDAERALSYWALRHARGKPDFHHRDAFALELD